MISSIHMLILSVSHLRNDLYCVEWDVKLYYTIPYCLSQIQLGYTKLTALDCSESADRGISTHSENVQHVTFHSSINPTGGDPVCMAWDGACSSISGSTVYT